MNISQPSPPSPVLKCADECMGGHCRGFWIILMCKRKPVTCSGELVFVGFPLLPPCKAVFYRQKRLILYSESTVLFFYSISYFRKCPCATDFSDGGWWNLGPETPYEWGRTFRKGVGGPWGYAKREVLSGKKGKVSAHEGTSNSPWRFLNFVFFPLVCDDSHGIWLKKSCIELQLIYKALHVFKVCSLMHLNICIYLWCHHHS